MTQFEIDKSGPISSQAPGAPLVDVILITYNQEEFVAQAIESVLAQQAEFAFRLIVGDDGSTDNTQPIIRSYVAKHPQLITPILDQRHRGLKDRDRVGIRAFEISTAKYIAWLDGDDYWTNPRKLERQVSFLEQHPDFAICYHNAAMTFVDGSRETINCLPPDQGAESTLEDLIFSNFIPTCAAVFRRGLFGELPEWLGTMGMGDWPIHILNAQYGKIGYLNEVMATYRVHQQGAWSSWSAIDRSLESIKMLDYVDAQLGFRYAKQIRAAQAEWYYQLAEVTYRAGAQRECRKYLGKYLALGGVHLDRRTLSLFLRVRLSLLYGALKSVRDAGRRKQEPADGVVNNSRPAKG